MWTERLVMISKSDRGGEVASRTTSEPGTDRECAVSPDVREVIAKHCDEC